MENKLAHIRLGILGGGQLARMLALKCHELGISPHIFCTSLKDPASQVTAFSQPGNWNSPAHLKKFLKQVDRVIFENEFINTRLLQKASAQTAVSVHPDPGVMHILQNREQQKKLFASYKIPTAPYVVWGDSTSWKSLLQTFNQGMVLKKTGHGYDGYGTQIVSSPNHHRAGLKFIRQNKPRLIAEEFIPFRREMALILVRNQKGQMIELPLVQTHQRKACCVWGEGALYTS